MDRLGGKSQDTYKAAKSRSILFFYFILYWYQIVPEPKGALGYNNTAQKHLYLGVYIMPHIFLFELVTFGVKFRK